MNNLTDRQKIIQYSVRALGVLVFCICLISVLLCLDVQTRYLDRIMPLAHASALAHADAILVLGASVKSDGEPSDALRDRLLTGINVYRAGKASTTLITGDDGGFHANEIAVMQRFLTDHGIPGEAVRVDGQGYRTYESCKRAAEEGIRHAIIVTQRFHIARALYLCNMLGVDSYGVIADRQTYSRIIYFWTRDLIASVKAWVDVQLWSPRSPIESDG